MVSTFSLSPLAKENESLNHLPLMALKKGAFTNTLGTGQGQYAVKLATWIEYSGHSSHEPKFCLFPDKRSVIRPEIIDDSRGYARLSGPCSCVMNPARGLKLRSEEVSSTSQTPYSVSDVFCILSK